MWFFLFSLKMKQVTLQRTVDSGFWEPLAKHTLTLTKEWGANQKFQNMLPFLPSSERWDWSACRGSSPSGSTNIWALANAQPCHLLALATIEEGTSILNFLPNTLPYLYICSTLCFIFICVAHFLFSSKLNYIALMLIQTLILEENHSYSIL